MIAPVMTRTLRRAALALALSACGLAQAATLHVDLDTSFLSGMDGYLDLQFGRGGHSADATALVSHLSGVGAALPDLTGNVTALGGGSYSFSNVDSGTFNDLFQAMHFGGKVSFDVSFSSLPSGSPAPDWSNFGVGLYGSDQATALGNADLSGSLLHLYWQPDAQGNGSVGVSVLDSAATVTAVPEPSSWLMLGAGLGLLGLVRRRRMSHN